jgi:hypothetical protein
MALLFLDLGDRRGGWSAPRPGRFTPGKDPVPIVQEAGWASGPVWTCAKHLAPTGIASPDRLARSQSLYRLSYPVHIYLQDLGKLILCQSDFVDVRTSTKRPPNADGRCWLAWQRSIDRRACLSFREPPHPNHNCTCESQPLQLTRHSSWIP